MQLNVFARSQVAAEPARFAAAGSESCRRNQLDLNQALSASNPEQVAAERATMQEAVSGAVTLLAFSAEMQVMPVNSNP